MTTDFNPESTRDQSLDKSVITSPPTPAKGLVITGLTVAVMLIFAFGIWIRFQDLGRMAYHHDESIHAYYSWQLFQKGPYHPDNNSYPTYYDPVYHGPFLYHIGALTFFLFGDSDFTGRLPFAVSGVFLLFVAWELRHIVGKRTAVLILLLCAISPVLTYFARFARNDTYVGAECLALIYCALRYFRASSEDPEGQSRWRWFLGMVFFLIIHYCTKENSYAHGAIYCSFLGLYAFYRLIIHSALKEGLSKRLPVLGFLVLAIVSFLLLPKGIETVATKDTEGFFPREIVVHKLTWNFFTYAGFASFLSSLVVLFLLAIQAFRQNDRRQRVQVVLFSVFALFIFLLGIFKKPSIFYFGAGLGFLALAFFFCLLMIALLPKTEFRRGIRWIFVEHNIFTKLYALYGWFSAFMFFYVILDVFKFPKWFPNNNPSHTTIWAGYWLFAAVVLLILFIFIYFLRRWAEKQEGEKQSSSSEDSGGAVPRMFITNYPLFLALGMVLILYSFFFTTMFGNPGIQKGGGLRDGIYEYVAHWVKIHDNPRIPGPSWYYLPRLLLYETLGLFTWFLALGIYSFRAIRERIQNVERPSLYWPWRFFLIFYSLFSILIYSELQEKVPWLLVHQALPLILLAGTFFGDLWERSRFKVIQVIAGAFFVVFALWSLKGNILLNCFNNDNPKEIMVYTQSDDTVTKIMREIEDIRYKTTEGLNTRISIKGTAQWPFSWYLRNYKNWSISVDKRAPIIITDKSEERSMRMMLGDKYTVRTYHFRSHWTPDLHSSAKGLLHPSNKDQFWKKIRRYAIYREIWSDTGSPEINLYVRKDFPPSVIPLDIELPAGAGGPAQRGQFKHSFGNRGTGQGLFIGPRSIATGPEGEIYVADSENARIQKFSPDGQFLLSFGRPGDGPGQFNSGWGGPRGVAVGPDGSVYVADTWYMQRGRVQKFNSSGRFILDWEGVDGFFGPRDLAVDSKGNVYVVDTGKKRIQKFDSNGKFIKTWGKDGGLQGDFDEPVGIAIDRNDQVYIADTGNQRVQIFDENGQFLRMINLLSWESEDTVGIEPYIAVDPEGKIYVTDSVQGAVIQISQDGKKVTPWGIQGSGPGNLDKPSGIAVALNGDILVADRNLCRISIFSAK